MDRRWGVVGTLVLVGVVATGLSYRAAAHTAARTLCQLPADTELNRVRFGPRVLPGHDLTLSWAFSYGPKAIPGHIGFQLYLSPTGRLVMSNPPALLSRLPALHHRHGVSCGGTA
jgi:hypothetical protein